MCVAAGVLDALDAALSSYIHFPSEAMRHAVVLWAAHTHVWDVHVDGHPLFDVVPYLWVKSAGRSSGKTTLADLLVPVVNNGMRTDHMTAAALYRLLGQGAFTPLFDEADQSIREQREEDSDSGKRLAVLNSGFRRGGKVYLVDTKTNEPKEFPTFGPKAIVGINVKVADTLSSRCIHVTLERAKQGEVTKHYRERTSRPQMEKVGRQLAEAMATVKLEPLGDETDPRLGFIENREADIWEVMLATADAVGGHWPKRCIDAAKALVEADQSLSLSEMLLRDVLAILKDSKQDHLPTKELLGWPTGPIHEGKGLLGMDSSPWATYGRNGLSAVRLADLLRPYGVSPDRKSLAGGAKTPQGYHLRDVERAWARWGHPTKEEDEETAETEEEGRRGDPVEGEQTPLWVPDEGGDTSVADPVYPVYPVSGREEGA